MTAALALLRGVNVGGRRKVPMADLRAIVESFGHSEVATLLNSGNVVFAASGGAEFDAAAAAADITAGVRGRLGLEVDVVVRTAAQVDAVVAANPFVEAARTDPSHLVVVFYSDPVRDAVLDMSRHGSEQVVWDGAQAYVTYPEGIGRSTLTADALDRAAGQPGTGRNWRTVLALQELLLARA
ncbi:DUF1697 domain-containing protein [Cellulomonas chengniuliangii]|uniref:DUF1697 domain-containing protein n=1 Tax=Cellulomonas chengniuliangii TaxID=2968084 RepID=A0ABY5KVQ9_9CELL|nr:DUF1697 domain-containing protein [Cellulomonas chengniuliangii]MCC2310026.1 DUF1697 domain-containing protein [Cellulomonas chengniuliangii]UUI74577.1 DUF1697 domain-containing protein [Cellulomonas chengniuliangii]